MPLCPRAEEYAGNGHTIFNKIPCVCCQRNDGCNDCFSHRQSSLRGTWDSSPLKVPNQCLESFFPVLVISTMHKSLVLQILSWSLLYKLIKNPLESLHSRTPLTLSEAAFLFFHTFHLCCINTREAMSVSVGQIKAIPHRAWMKQTASKLYWLKETEFVINRAVYEVVNWLRMLCFAKLV